MCSQCWMGLFLPAVSKDCQHEAAGGDQGDGQRVDGAYVFAEKGDGEQDGKYHAELVNRGDL